MDICDLDIASKFILSLRPPLSLIIDTVPPVALSASPHVHGSLSLTPEPPLASFPSRFSVYLSVNQAKPWSYKRSYGAGVIISASTVCLDMITG